ncbi:WD40-repeat-containing domain protein [Chytriomyces sp. MP71]|nr:WD40-repeat-containing domain protein [Chytriomyces sp. MP71]
MISDETKAAIVKKTSAAILVSNPPFDTLVSPLSNLNMIADAAATAEASMALGDHQAVANCDHKAVIYKPREESLAGSNRPTYGFLDTSSTAVKNQSPSRQSGQNTGPIQNMNNPYNMDTDSMRRDSGFISTHAPASPQMCHQGNLNRLILQPSNGDHHQDKNFQEASEKYSAIISQHKPFSSQGQSAPTCATTLSMTSIATRLQLNPTAIPAPQAYTHPIMGPTVSWTAAVLQDRNITLEDPAANDSNLHATQQLLRGAFSTCDAIILQAVKERNQFLEIARTLVTECARSRDVSGRYSRVLGQVVHLLPPSVRCGVQMDLDAIEKFAKDNGSIKLQSHIPLPMQSTTPTAPDIRGVLVQSERATLQSRHSTSAPELDPRKRSCTPQNQIDQQQHEASSIAKRACVDDSGSLTHNSDGSLQKAGELKDGSSYTRPPMTQNSNQTQKQQHQQQQQQQQQKPQQSQPQQQVPPSQPPRGYALFTAAMNKEVVCAMALSKPFKYLFTGALGTIKIWDVSVAGLQEAPLVGTIELSTSYIRAIRITQDGKILVAGGEGQDVSICNINTITPHVIWKIPTNGFEIYTITLTHDSRIAIMGGNDHCIQVWELMTRQCTRTMNGHTASVTCSSLSRDGTKLYSGSIDKSVRLWDMATGDCLEVFSFPSPIHSFDLNPLTPILTVGLQDGIAQRVLWRNNKDDTTTTSAVVYVVDGTDACPFVKYSRSGTWWVGGSMNGGLSVFKEASFQRQPGGGGAMHRTGPVKLYDLPTENSAVICGELSACGAFVVTGGSGKIARVYRVVE